MSKKKIRSREEIQADVDRKGAVQSLLLEVLLDIRELLAEK